MTMLIWYQGYIVPMMGVKMLWLYSQGCVFTHYQISYAAHDDNVQLWWTIVLHLGADVKNIEK